MNDDQPSFSIFDHREDLKEAQLALNSARCQVQNLLNIVEWDSDYRHERLQEAAAKVADAQHELDMLQDEPCTARLLNEALSALAEAKREQIGIQINVQREVNVSFEALRQARLEVNRAERNVQIYDSEMDQPDYLPTFLRD
jgi:hypothetical protein